MITIEKLRNGYIITKHKIFTERDIYKTLDEVFDQLLLSFEGRSEHFYENSYGKVIIDRDGSKHPISKYNCH